MDENKLERLAHLEMHIGLHEDVLHETADLCLRLHQQSARNAGAVLPRAMMRTYTERSETEQLGMRSAVQHVVHALLLLDLVDLRR